MKHILRFFTGAVLFAISFAVVLAIGVPLYFIIVEKNYYWGIPYAAVFFYLVGTPWVKR